MNFERIREDLAIAEASARARLELYDFEFELLLDDWNDGNRLKSESFSELVDLAVRRVDLRDPEPKTVFEQRNNALVSAATFYFEATPLEIERLTKDFDSSAALGWAARELLSTSRYEPSTFLVTLGVAALVSGAEDERDIVASVAPVLEAARADGYDVDHVIAEMLVGATKSGAAILERLKTTEVG